MPSATRSGGIAAQAIAAVAVPVTRDKIFEPIDNLKSTANWETDCSYGSVPGSGVRATNVAKLLPSLMIRQERELLFSEAKGLRRHGEARAAHPVVS
jgi:hypothetical protein